MKNEEVVPGVPPDNANGGPKPRRISLEAIPSWLQGIAAITGVLLTAIGFFVFRGPSTPPTTTSSQESAVVILESVTIGATEVQAFGLFQLLDPAIDAVLFIGQPIGDPGALWLPVVASISPTLTETDGRQSGRWEAVRPKTEAGIDYSWYVVVGPKAVGADDPYTDLKENGPLSELVKAASEPIVTTG